MQMELMVCHKIRKLGSSEALIISPCACFKESLNAVKDGYMNRYITKEEYTNVLREYQKSQQDEMKNEERSKEESMH